MKMLIRESKWRTDPLRLAELDTIEEELGFTSSLRDMGWGNGYVVLDKDHPWFDIEYDDIPVDVHGGLTYGSIIDNLTISHFSPHLEESDIGKYLIGFDTSHYMDNIQNCSREYVLAETQNFMINV